MTGSGSHGWHSSDTTRGHGQRRPTAQGRGDPQLFTRPIGQPEPGLRPQHHPSPLWLIKPRAPERLLSHPLDLDAPLRLAAQRNINSYRQQSEHFFSPRHHEHKHTHARRVFASSFSTGRPGDRGALHCRWTATATQPIGLVPFQARSILPVPEEQSRTRGGQSSGAEDQPQY